jgi:ABC-type branched-subunit amino acid transport system substrate-binding protein
VPSLAERIAHRVGQGSLVWVSITDHDSRLFATELARALAKHRIAASFRFECKPGPQAAEQLVGSVLRSEPTSVVVIGGVNDSATWVVALRDRGFRGDIFGTPAMGCHRFMERTGSTANGVLFPLLYGPPAANDRFAARFQRELGHSPDYTAACTYDAVRLVIAAIQAKGLNRARIRDAICELAPWEGVAGQVHWDGLGSNTRRVPVGTIIQGHVAVAPEHSARPESPPQSDP